MKEFKLSIEDIIKMAQRIMEGRSPDYENLPSHGLRVQLTSEDDGSVYSRTSCFKGVWQDSHYHAGMREIIAVQEGWIAFADLFGAKGLANVRILRKGESVTVQPCMSHSIYMPAGAVIHSLQFGDTVVGNADGQKNWHVSPELDKHIKHLDEEQIAIYGNRNRR